MGMKKPITYDEALTEAALINDMLVCKGKADGSDIAAVGYYVVYDGARWLRVVDVNERKRELDEAELG